MLLFHGVQNPESAARLDAAKHVAPNVKAMAATAMAATPNPATHAIPDDKTMPHADFSGELAVSSDMRPIRSEVSQHYQRKDFTVSSKNQSFLDQAREALMFARLGVDKDEIDQIKAKMAELQALYAEGKMSEEDLQAQMEALQAQLSEELQEAQTRREQAEQKEFTV
jgi:hypothetical protein